MARFILFRASSSCRKPKVRAGAISARKPARREGEGEMLLADGGGGKLDLEVIGQRVGRQQAGAGVAACPTVTGFSTLMAVRGLRLFRQPGAFQQVEIGQRIAVQDGRLRPVQADQQIVDLRRPPPPPSDARPRRPGAALLDHRAQPGLAHQVIAGGNIARPDRCGETRRRCRTAPGDRVMVTGTPACRAVPVAVISRAMVRRGVMAASYKAKRAAR